MEQIETKDFFGTKILPGHFIVYPGRTGSALWMNVAEVIEVKKFSYKYSTHERIKLVIRRKSKNYRGEVREKITTLVRTDLVIVISGMSWEKAMAA